MAWLEIHPTSGHFKICFRWGGRKLKTTLKTQSRNGVAMKHLKGLSLGVQRQDVAVKQIRAGK